MINLEGTTQHEQAAPLPPRRKFDMEVLVGYILLGGVLLSLLLIVLGLVWHWLTTGQVGFNYSITGMNLFQFVAQEFRLALHGGLRPRLLADLGIAALMFTPYVRVLASMVYFAFAAHNWKYTLFTAFVFSVLTYSLFVR